MEILSLLISLLKLKYLLLEWISLLTIKRIKEVELD